MRTTPNRKIAAIFVSLLVVCLPLPSLAQALADHVPADAIGYIGWKGADSPGAAYEGSHLQAILASSDLPKLFSDLTPNVVARISVENRAIAGITNSLMGIGGVVWRHPGAIYFGGVDLTDPAKPMPRLAILCAGGDEAAALAGKINVLLLPLGPPWHCRLVDKVVIVANFAMPDHPADTLSSDAAFGTAMKGLVSDPFIAVYFNGVAAWPMVDSVVAQQAPPEFARNWPHLRDELGLTGLNHYAATEGFEGKNWVMDVLIDAPAPRHGLLARGDPLADELVRAIPDTSVHVAAMTFNLDAVFTLITRAAEAFSPDHGAGFHQGIDQVNAILGFDVQHDLLASFGPQWASYLDEDSAGSGIAGTVLMNRPRDPAQLADFLSRTEQAAMTLARPLKEKNISIEFRQFDAGGTTIHYLAAPLISPAWMVKDGIFYVALYPQMIEAAAARAADAKSILDNPQFLALRKQLGAPDKVNTMLFDDLPRTVPQGYQSWLAISRLYLGMGDIFGVPTPPMVLPPLRKIRAELEPSGGFAWADDAGLHAKATTPFPGAEAIAAGGNASMMSIGETSMMISILLPSLNRARETANRVKCANNLKQIGLGIQLYMNDNAGAYPPDLGTLVTKETLTAEVFCCPASGTQPPPNLAPADAAAWVNANSDYTYLAGPLRRMAAPDMVIAYEKDSDHNGDGMNLLFADGHVEFDTLEAAHQQIERTKKALGL